MKLKKMRDDNRQISHYGDFNKLPIAKRAMILNVPVEGMSMRSVSRVAGVSINTVSELLADAGEACAAYRDEHAAFQALRSIAFRQAA